MMTLSSDFTTPILFLYSMPSCTTLIHDPIYVIEHAFRFFTAQEWFWLQDDHGVAYSICTWTIFDAERRYGTIRV